MAKWALLSCVVIMHALVQQNMAKMLFHNVHKIVDVDLEVENKEHDRFKRDTGGTDLPDKLNVHIMMEEGRKTLNLKRNKDTPTPKVTVVTKDGPKDLTQNVNKNLPPMAHYQDRKTGAAILVKRSAENHNDYHIFGSFYENNLKYGIEPSRVQRSTDKTQHSIGLYKKQDEISKGGKKKGNGKDETVSTMKKIPNDLLSALLNRKRRDIPTLNIAYAETGYYIGVTEYQFMKHLVQTVPGISSFILANGTGDIDYVGGSIDPETVFFLFTYVGFLNNEVNLRFESIIDAQTDPDIYGAFLVYSAITVFAEPPTGITFFEDSIFNTGKLVAQTFLANAGPGSYEAGWDLHIAITREQWDESSTTPAIIASARPQDPENVAFCGDYNSVCSTTQNLCVVSDLDGLNVVSALSKAAGIAITWSGVGVRILQYYTWDPIANGFIHSWNSCIRSGHQDRFGANVEGDDSACADPNYVMADNFQFPENLTNNRLWEFSQCSVDTIKGNILIAFLISSAPNKCILSPRDGEYRYAASNFTNTTYGGQILNGDHQCALEFNSSDAVVCREDYSGGDYRNICFEGMLCKVPGNPQCLRILPLDNTQCANNSLCYKGMCIEDDGARSDVSDICPFDDDPSANCPAQDCSDPVIRDYVCCVDCTMRTTTTTSTTTTTTTTRTTSTTTPITTTTTQSSTTSTTPSTTTITGEPTTTRTTEFVTPPLTPPPNPPPSPPFPGGSPLPPDGGPTGSSSSDSSSSSDDTADSNEQYTDFFGKPIGSKSSSFSSELLASRSSEDVEQPKSYFFSYFF